MTAALYIDTSVRAPLAPIHCIDTTAIEGARVAREAMEAIRRKMAASQLGEAFYDYMNDPEGRLEVPTFLRRQPGAPADTTPMPRWIAEAAARVSADKWGSTHKPIQDLPTAIDADLTGIELEARQMKRSARSELAAQDKDAAAVKEAKARAKRNKRLGLPEDTPDPVNAGAVPEGHWDAAHNAWRPVDYMSLARYRRLLLSMPGPAYRAAFIKAFGHTQAPEHRDPNPRSMAQLRHTMGIPEPAEVTPPKATKAAGPSAPAAQPKTKAAAPAKAKPKGKSIAQSKSVGAEGNRVASTVADQMLALLDRKQGCTLEELGAPFDWKPHTAGARLSALKKAGHTFAKEKETRGTVYRRTNKEDTK